MDKQIYQRDTVFFLKPFEFLGKIVNDQHIYKTIDSLATNINSLVSNFKKNPKKYINVSVF